MASALLTGWLYQSEPSRLVRQVATILPHSRFLHLGRILLSLAGVFFWQKALTYLPMAQIMALNFLGPMITASLAFFVLKEPLPWNRIAIIGLSLIGAALTSSPQFLLGQMPYPDWGWFLLYPLGASVCWSLVTILSKKIVHRESQEAATWKLFIGLSLGFWIGSCTESWSSIPLNFNTGLILIGLGSITGLAHLSLATAFQKAEVVFLLPFGCIRCLLSMGIGLFWFHQPIHPLSLMGVALILMSHGLSLFNAFRDRQKALKEK